MTITPRQAQVPDESAGAREYPTMHYPAPLRLCQECSLNTPITGVAIFCGGVRGAMATLGGTPVFRAGFSVAMLAGKVLRLS